jgi:hypothetical protein
MVVPVKGNILYHKRVSHPQTMKIGNPPFVPFSKGEAGTSVKLFCRQFIMTAPSPSNHEN